MKRSLILLILAAGVAWPQSKDELDKALKTIKAADIQRHQIYIASDELEGRESGSDGAHKASSYIVEHIQKLGFEPGGVDGSYFQPFGTGAASSGDVAEANCLRLFKDTTLKQNEMFKLNDHVLPIRGSKCGSIQGTVVFAGYGIMAPELGYEDYKTATVKGAIALILDGEPQEKDEASKFDGAKPSKYSEMAHKIEQAEKAGAAALLIAKGPLNTTEKGLPKLADSGWPPPTDKREIKTKIPVMLISTELAENLAKAGSKTLKTLQEDIDKEFKPKMFKLTRPVRVSVSFTGLMGKGVKNIIGIWRGSDEKKKDEYIIIGAHYDHVGKGLFGSNGGKRGEIHNGADDNGSGTSTLLEVAEAIKETKPERSIAVMWFDGEEKGLLGSNHWTGAPTLPFDKVMWMINIDMIGRNDIKQILLGVEKEGGTPKYPKLEKLMKDCEKTFNFKFDWDGADDLIQRSDHWGFMQKGLPAVFFTGGLHADYHTDRDDVEKINFPKEELIGKMALWLAMKTAPMDGGLK